MVTKTKLEVEFTEKELGLIAKSVGRPVEDLTVEDLDHFIVDACLATFVGIMGRQETKTT